MSRADRKWRPSDADRERYAGAISQAFAEGRIDATDMESRTALVYEAASIADLDALVEDMPAPAPATPAPVATATRSSGIGVGAVVAAVAVVLVILFAVLSSITDGFTSADPASGLPEAPPPAVAAPLPQEPLPPAQPDPADLPDIDTVKLGLFTAEGLSEMWAAMPAAGHTDLFAITLFADRATVYASAGTERPAIATVEYQGGLALPPERYRDLTSGDPALFTWIDVPPEAVLAAIEAMPGVTGVPDVTVGHISIDNSADRGITINVYPEGDTGITYAKFDATGTQVLNVY